MLVADEPDPERPDDWLIHAYFEHQPGSEELALLASLGTGQPELEQLGEADWVTMSQSGLQPIVAGRFFVHTPMHRAAPPDSIAFEIDAGLAFGTGQHATTAGCLEALDALERGGASFANIADIGTGTGLLAFAALACGPRRSASPPTSTQSPSTSPATMRRSTASPSATARASCCSPPPTAWITR